MTTTTYTIVAELAPQLQQTVTFFQTDGHWAYIALTGVVVILYKMLGEYSFLLTIALLIGAIWVGANAFGVTFDNNLQHGISHVLNQK